MSSMFMVELKWIACIQHLKVEHFFFDGTITYPFCLNFQSFDDSNKAEHAKKKNVNWKYEETKWV